MDKPSFMFEYRKLLSLPGRSWLRLRSNWLAKKTLAQRTQNENNCDFLKFLGRPCSSGLCVYTWEFSNPNNNHTPHEQGSSQTIVKLKKEQSIRTESHNFMLGMCGLLALSRKRGYVVILYQASSPKFWLT